MLMWCIKSGASQGGQPDQSSGRAKVHDAAAIRVQDGSFGRAAKKVCFAWPHCHITILDSSRSCNRGIKSGYQMIFSRMSSLGRAKAWEERRLGEVGDT
jgi:hypothetical protein